MPRKHQKLLERARHNKSGWKARELIYLIEKYGFEFSSAHGSHQTYLYSELNLRITVPVHPSEELGNYYIANAVELIDEVVEYEKNKDKEKDNDEQPS